MFEHAPHVGIRVANALVDPAEFGFEDSPELVEETTSHHIKQYQGTPVELYCDGGFAANVGAIGFCVVADDRVLKSVGDCHIGFSNN